MAGWGGVGQVGVSRVGSDKNLCLGYPMNRHDAHTVANDTSGPQSQWEQTQVPTAQLVPSIDAIVSVMTLEGQQTATGQNCLHPID